MAFRLSLRAQAILFTLFAFGLSVLLFSFMWEQGDTISYVRAAEGFWSWDASQDRLHRLSKPFALLLPATAYHYWQVPVIWSLWAQQVLCYFMSAWLWWRILAKIGKSEEECFWGLMLLLLCQPMSIYGLSFMMDGVGWCLSLWGIFLVIRWFPYPRVAPRRKAVLLGEVLAIGVLTKESALLGGLLLCIHLLIHDYSWKNRLLSLFRVGINFVVVLVGFSLFTLVFFSKTLLTWMAFAHTDPIVYDAPWKALLTQTYRTLDVFWLLVILGFLVEGLANRNKHLNANERSLLFTGLVAWMIFPWLWAYYVDRILFMFAPLWLPWALYALHRLAYPRLILLLGGLMNLGMTHLIYRYQQSGLILGATALFALFLALAWWWKRRATTIKTS